MLVVGFAWEQIRRGARRWCERQRESKPAENGVLVVKPWRRDGGDEKLRTIRVRPGIGHGQGKGAIMAQRAMELILEFPSPYGRATCAVAQWVSCFFCV